MGNGKRTTQSETIMIRVARVASQLLPSVTASIAMVGAMVPSARPRPQMQNTTLLSITHEHDDVYSYRSSCPASLEYRAGQYLHLVAPGAKPSKQTVRHMSFASAPSESELLFTMDLSSRSEYKSRFASLRPGDELSFFKVKGAFVLSDQMREVVFIAGGVGITPIRSLTMDVETENKNVTWELLHVARSTHLYQEELQQLPAQQTRTNRQGADAALQAIVSQRPRATYFISGSDSFVQGMKEHCL